MKLALRAIGLFARSLQRIALALEEHNRLYKVELEHNNISTAKITYDPHDSSTLDETEVCYGDAGLLPPNSDDELERPVWDTPERSFLPRRPNHTN